MVDFHVTSDNGSGDSIEPVAKAIEAEGFTVETSPSSPNAEALRNDGTVKPPTKLVFICNGGIAGQTYGSFALDYQDGMCFTIFAFDNYATHFSTTTENALRTMPLVSEGDSGGFATQEAADDFAGHTTCSYQEKYPQVFAFIADETSAESLGKRIAHGDYTCGGNGGTTQTSNGGGAKIKDKTFEKCIRRICAATDSVFLVENNAAILFPYTDWMAFVLEAKIQSISAKEMDPDIFEIEYNSEGYYNKVVGWWGDVEIPDRFVADEKTGKIKRNTETVAELSEIGKQLAAKYGGTVMGAISDVELARETLGESANLVTQDGKSVLISKPAAIGNSITKKEGNVTTTETSLGNGGVQLAKQYDPLVDIYGELEKRVTTPYPDRETAEYALNALLIQYVRDFNNKCRVRTLNTKKYIGGTFYMVENPYNKKKTMFYLNGYTIRTQKDEPLYLDLDFRYGPEGAEELLDYQYLTGGASGGTTGGSSSEEEVWKRAEIPCHQWSCGELREAESDTQDPQVAEDYYNKKVKEGKKFCLTCYGMSAFLHYEFNQKAGIACQVVGNSDHHVVMLDRGDGKGFVETREEYRKHCDKGFRWDTDTPTTVLLPATVGSKGKTNSSSSNNNTSGNNNVPPGGAT